MVSVFVGILALSALAGFLALCLETADSYFADYGECRISINEGDRELVVQGGGHLLGILTDEGIFIPSACGGRGSCGLCKVKVSEGAGPLLPTETPYLDKKEIEDQVRLSCQVKVRNDLAIHIPPELFYIKEFTARISGLRDIAEDMKEVRLKLVDPPVMEFKAGQFVQLRIPEYGDSDEPVYRAYSIASPASKGEEIHLIITRVPQGIATTYVHEHLNEGDETLLNGPHGEFYLRDSERDVLLVATGSGLAPIMSILHHLADENIRRKVFLVFGARRMGDLFYLEELNRLKERIPDLKVVHTLSRPEEHEQWEGPRGRVTDVIPDLVKDPSNVEAYICGNPAMVESVEQQLTQMGVPKEQIFYDKFA